MDNLVEASLSRVWQMATDPARVFAILTAFRGEYTLPENRDRNIELGRELRSQGYGFWTLDGFWVENAGTPQEEHVAEDAFFVSAPLHDGAKTEQVARADTLTRLAAEFEDNILELVRKYDQEAAIVKGPSAEQVELLFQDGNKQGIGHFHPSKVAQAYSRIRGSNQTFVFESAKPRRGFASALVEKFLRESHA